MMEDPEARRARLKAMREQAEGVSQSAPILENSTAKLANPFKEVAPISDAHTPRFNYYSNPAAGFVPTRRKEPGPPAGMSLSINARPHGNWNPEVYPPAPVPPPLGPSYLGGFGSPIPLYNPMQPGFLPPPALEPQQRYGDGTWPIKRPNFGPGRGVGRGFGGRGPGPGRAGFARGDSNHGRGGFARGDSNRGRERGDGNQARGRGGGSISARDRPDLFYHKSMVEDPWRHLL